MTHDKAQDIITAGLIPVFTWGAVANLVSPDMSLAFFTALFFCAVGVSVVAASVVSAALIVVYEELSN